MPRFQSSRSHTRGSSAGTATGGGEVRHGSGMSKSMSMSMSMSMSAMGGIFGWASSSSSINSSSKGQGHAASFAAPTSAPLPHTHSTITTPTSPPSKSPSLESIAEGPLRSRGNSHSHGNGIADLASIRSSLRRSVSLHSQTRPQTSYTSTRAAHHIQRPKSPSSYTLALSYSPERGSHGPHASSRPTLSISTFARSRQKSAENFRQLNDRSPLSAVDPKSSVGMAAVPIRYPPSSRPIGTSHSNAGFGQSSNGALGPAAPIVPGAASGHNPHVVFQHIHDMASKRISTLDYLRKANEGRVYWFNTLLFSKGDLTKLGYFDPRKLSRRATNYLLLGFSLPTILDLNSQSPTDYLRALNALLIEFETYQSIHPPDGSAPSSLSRGRIPQMFKRATAAAGGKGRRSSSAASEIGLGGFSSEDFKSSSTPGSGGTAPSEHDLLPGEEYTLLLTPSLPFEPDFFETFATLCDVLIDCYTKVMSLINSPETCVPGVGDLFAKADARVRKIIVAGVVREFEDASRQGVKGEVAGVGKVVLGGLM